MLAGLNPTISNFLATNIDSGNRVLSPEDQAKRLAAKKTGCIACRSRGRIKVLEDGDTQKTWRPCPECGGSKKRKVPSETETRSYRKDRILSVEQLSFALAGMEPHILRAALVYATHDETARLALIKDISKLLVKPIADELSADDRSIIGLSRVVSYNLKMREGVHIVPLRGAELLSVSERTWYRSWSQPSKELTDKARGWILVANDHMKHRLTVDQSACASAPPVCN